MPELNMGQLLGAAREVPGGRRRLEQDSGRPFKQNELEQKIDEMLGPRRRDDHQAAFPPLTKKDFQTDQEVRWCPGCGDYAILAAVQAVFPELGVPRENFVVVSGIGCSSRFPIT